MNARMKPKRKPGDFALLLGDDEEKPKRGAEKDSGAAVADDDDEHDEHGLDDDDDFALGDDPSDPAAGDDPGSEGDAPIDPEQAQLAVTLGFTEPDQQRALIDLIKLVAVPADSSSLPMTPPESSI